MSSFGNPLQDILRDAFHKPSERSYLILTDQNVLLRIFPREFRVYTTDPNRCKDFGSGVQRSQGYMCHGFTKHRVKTPYEGQPIFMMTDRRNGPIFSGHKIRRIYYQNITDLLTDPWGHILSISDKVGGIDLTGVQVTTDIPNPLDDFLKHLLIRATFVISGNSMILSNGTDLLDSLTQSHKLTEGDILSIYMSGFIFDSEKDNYVISDALYILFMEAIHRARPMTTFFDVQGILQTG